MKTTHFFFLFSLIALSVFITGCDDDEGYQPSQTKLLPSSIERFMNSGDPSDFSSSSIKWSFEYDSQNRIVCIYERYSEDDYTTIYTYTFNGQDITETTTRDDNSNYNKIIEYKFRGNIVEIGGGNTISIDNNLRESDMKYDNKGNAINRQGTNYRYDQENGVFRHVNMPPWFLSTHLSFIGLNVYNNCTFEDNGNHQYDYIIKYNADNYPTSINREAIDLIGSSLLRYDIEYSNLK